MLNCIFFISQWDSTGGSRCSLSQQGCWGIRGGSAILKDGERSTRTVFPKVALARCQPTFSTVLRSVSEISSLWWNMSTCSNWNTRLNKHLLKWFAEAEFPLLSQGEPFCPSQQRASIKRPDYIMKCLTTTVSCWLFRSSLPGIANSFYFARWD